MQWLRSRVARSPRPALRLGKALILAGGILVLAALFGRFQLMELNAQRADSGQPALLTLAAAYPQYPTWLVPEGPVGLTVAGVLVALGTLLASLANDVLKQRDRMTPW